MREEDERFLHGTDQLTHRVTSILIDVATYRELPASHHPTGDNDQTSTQEAIWISGNVTSTTYTKHQKTSVNYHP